MSSSLNKNEGSFSEVIQVAPKYPEAGLRAIVELEKYPNPYSSSTWTERPYSDAWRKRMAEHKKGIHDIRLLWVFQNTILQAYWKFISYLAIRYVLPLLEPLLATLVILITTQWKWRSLKYVRANYEKGLGR
ncbi:hypothetical protein [Pseudomonas protegens]|uniref:hypothetical protein n=1 Tax=Pseudomonas protegens TaxID=380021 RepID=UPI0031F57F98